MCFGPQRRTLFHHPNVQKWREHVVFCTFWLGNVLRATAACTFSTSEPPKVVRAWCVLYFLTWKCASRHNGVHFFNISTSKSGEVFCAFWLGNVLRATTTCAFLTSHGVLYILTWKCASRHNGVQFFISGQLAPHPPLFDPPEPQIIGKTQCFATFLPFRASASAFFWLFLFYSSFFWSFSSLCLFPALLFICPCCRKFDF